MDCWVENPCYRRKTPLVVGETQIQVCRISVPVETIIPLPVIAVIWKLPPIISAMNAKPSYPVANAVFTSVSLCMFDQRWTLTNANQNLVRDKQIVVRVQLDFIDEYNQSTTKCQRQPNVTDNCCSQLPSTMKFIDCSRRNKSAGYIMLATMVDGNNESIKITSLS